MPSYVKEIQALSQDDQHSEIEELANEHLDLIQDSEKFASMVAEVGMAMSVDEVLVESYQIGAHAITGKLSYVATEDGVNTGLEIHGDADFVIDDEKRPTLSNITASSSEGDDDEEEDDDEELEDDDEEDDDDFDDEEDDDDAVEVEEDDEDSDDFDDDEEDE